MRDGRIENVLVVGGGSAGWLTAAMLHRAFAGRVNVALVESDRVDRVGVGEATVPTIKPQVFDFLQLPEEAWMPACNATYKIGIKFANWAYGPERPNSFYSILAEGATVDGLPLTHYWLHKASKGFNHQPMAHACDPGAHFCDAGRAPRAADGTALVSAAYHLDAQLLAELLRDTSKRRGVEHILDDVIDVNMGADGNIASVQLEKNGPRSADLFIDCTGFQGLLINGALNEPFTSYGKTLLNNRAVATRVKIDPGWAIPPYVLAAAQPEGWTWEIPLANRVGCGYVFADAFVSPEDAERHFRAYLCTRYKTEHVNEAEFFHLKMRIGRNRNAWVKNCVSIGLSGGFIEPLESTGIYTAHAAVQLLIRHFPNRASWQSSQTLFNERIAFMFDDVMEFIALHFSTNQREDNDYWRANKYGIEKPASLQEVLERYHAGLPIRPRYAGSSLGDYVFDASFDRLWTNWNYVSVLSGKDILPSAGVPAVELRSTSMERAEAELARVERETKELLSKSATHREYIDSMRKEKS